MLVTHLLPKVLGKLNAPAGVVIESAKQCLERGKKASIAGS